MPAYATTMMPKSGIRMVVKAFRFRADISCCGDAGGPDGWALSVWLNEPIRESYSGDGDARRILGDGDSDEIGDDDGSSSGGGLGALHPKTRSSAGP